MEAPGCSNALADGVSDLRVIDRHGFVDHDLECISGRPGSPTGGRASAEAVRNDQTD